LHCKAAGHTVGLMARWIALIVVVAVGIVLLITTGWVAFLVYGFLALMAAIIMWGTALGGQVDKKLSRGRFDDTGR
jgi:hypothetical protein